MRHAFLLAAAIGRVLGSAGAMVWTWSSGSPGVGGRVAIGDAGSSG